MEVKYFSDMAEVPDYDLVEPFYKEGVKWTSRHNFELEKKHIDKVVIHDVTLRDGDQTPGSVFLEDERVRIADALAEMKVPRIEAGMPNVSRAVENACAVWCLGTIRIQRSTASSGQWRQMWIYPGTLVVTALLLSTA